MKENTLPGPSPEGIRLIEEARECWMAWAPFREERQRNKRYTYGRQWDDTITVEGETMTETEYITRQGHIPLKNNLIRRLVRNVLGTYRDTRSPMRLRDLRPARSPSLYGPDPADDTRGLTEEQIDAMLDEVERANSLPDIMARSLEEFLISGFVVHRKWYGSRRGRTGCWTEYVSPDLFFMDTVSRDFRGWDLTLAGEIHDLPFPRLADALGAGREECRQLAEIYRARTGDTRGLCRVYEIWRRESLPRYRCHDTLTGELFRIDESDHRRLVENVNLRRRGNAAGTPREIEAEWFLDDVWRHYHVTPDGRILASGESPYAHGGHPYVFKAYPFIDGEIHSFVADVIDQQRYTNRLITLYDWVMRASAKGVLLFPEGALPDGWELQDVADEWSRFNGVIMIRTKEGQPLPQQISSNAVNIGVTELLDIQMKLFEDISGVNGALQGKLESGAVSGTLYERQTRHALTSLLDLLETFRSFERDGAAIDLGNLLRFTPAL